MATDNVTATPAPMPLETTPTIEMDWTRLIVEQVQRERKLFLALVDEQERMLIALGCFNGPRTAQIRKWWWEQQG